MPAKRIIMLEREGETGSTTAYNYVLWVDVPASRQKFYADLAFQSAYRDATTLEETALQSGAVLEEKREFDSANALVDLRPVFEAQWQELQDKINNTGKDEFGQYGEFWDGVSWNPAV